MADYVLSAKGTYDGSDMDSGLEKSKSKLSELKSTAQSVGSEVSGFFKTAFSSVAETVTGTIGSITAGVAGLTITGGISRALNIEQAQYKLKQLGMDVDSIMESANEAVSGTSFGLDAAATSAALLAASGVQAGDSMTQALKASAGMATIAGTDISEIADIFSDVSAAGKVSGDTLNSFAARGLSATNALATYLGKTQQEVKEMVSEGEIDFQTFSDAMYASFGDAAYGANDTFSGAMSNVRAALSRVGEKFADPALDGLRQIFVALIPAINSAKDALVPVAEVFGQWVDTVVPKVVEWIGKLQEKLDGLGEGGLLNLGTGAKVAAAGLAVLAGVSLSGLIAEIPIVGGAISSLTGNLVPNIGRVVSAFTSLSAPAAAVVVVITAVVAAFAYLMATNEEFRTTIMGLVDNIIGSLTPAFESLTALIEPIQGLFAALVGAVQVLAPAILEIAAALAPLVATLIESLVPIIGTIIEILTQVINEVMPVVSEAISAIALLIETLMPYIQGIVETVMYTIKAVIDDVWPAIQAVIETVMNIIMDVIDVVTAAINGDWDAMWTAVGKLFEDIWNGIWNILSNILNAAWNLLGDVLNMIYDLWCNIWNLISDFFKGIWDAICNIVSNAASTVSNVISDALNAISGWWNDTWSGIQSFLSDAWNNITSGVSNGIDTVLDFFINLPNNILNALGNLGSLLWDAGSQIMSGLFEGITSGVSGVYDFVSGIGSTIASLKGPKQYDLRLLIPNGGWIMDSLSKGLELGEKGLMNTLSGITGDIASFNFATPDVVYSTAAGGATAEGGIVDMDTTINVSVADAKEAKKAGQSIAQTLYDEYERRRRVDF